MDAASILLLLAVMGADVGRESEASPATPKRHASYFAGQSGWGADMSNPPPAAAPNYDRYQMVPSGSGATVSAPPSVVDRTQSAVVESGNALRDGVEAGIQAANRQLYQGGEQVIDTARNAGQDLSNQFQGWAGATAQQAQITAPSAAGTLPSTSSGRQQVSNPFTTSTPAASAASAAAPKSRGGLAPPPWTGSAAADDPAWPNDEAAPAATAAPASPRQAALGRAPVQTDSGWSSVHSSVAPPRLSAPRLIHTTDATAPLASPTARSAPLQPMVGQGGPNFPVTITSNQPVGRDVLPPAKQSPPLQQPPAVDSWDFGWDGKAPSQPAQQATIGNRYDTAAISTGADAAKGRGIVMAEQPATEAASQLAPQPTAGQIQGSQPATSLGIGAWDKSGWPANPATPQTGAVAQGDSAPGGAGVVGNAGTPPAMGSTAAAGTPPNMANAGTLVSGTTPPEGAAPTLPTSNADQLPWVPLLVVSVSLAGSIGANLFLGWSYIDARQKYRTLVQKTANKFRRATAA